MNRELKFRIWDELNKTFVKEPTKYKSLAISCDGRGVYIGHYDDCDVEDRYIIHQYTGKNDERGKEVYEGDIVYLNHYDVPAVDMSCLFKIIFEDGAFQLKPIKLGAPPNGGVSDFTWMRYIEGNDSEGNTIYRYELPPPKPICGMNRMRVIGNIFENPELLK